MYIYLFSCTKLSCTISTVYIIECTDDILSVSKVGAVTFSFYAITLFIGVIPYKVILYIEAFVLYICEATLVLKFFRIFLKDNIDRYYVSFLPKPNIDINISMNQVIADPHGYYAFMEYVIKEFCVGMCSMLLYTWYSTYIFIYAISIYVIM